jgi:hypothetical protein
MTTMTSGSFHDAESLRTDAVLRRFNEVFLTHDPSALHELVAEDCVIENTQPVPDGSRHEGKAACIALWTEIATMPGAHFEPESIISRGDLGEIRWRLVWGSDSRKLRTWRQSHARARWPDRRGARLRESFTIGLRSGLDPAAVNCHH